MQLEKDRLFLHAVNVSIPIYFGDTKPLDIQAPLPNYFKQAIQNLKLTV